MKTFFTENYKRILIHWILLFVFITLANLVWEYFDKDYRYNNHLIQLIMTLLLSIGLTYLKTKEEKKKEKK